MVAGRRCPSFRYAGERKGEKAGPFSYGNRGNSPGDLLKLYAAQHQDALYIVSVRVQDDVKPGNIFDLKIRGELYPLQRRHSQRIPTRLEALYVLQEQQAGYRKGLIMDISAGGALLSVGEPLDLFSKIMLVFDIFTGKDNALTTEMSGKVIREHGSSRKDAHSYGVEFDRPLSLLAG